MKTTWRPIRFYSLLIACFFCPSSQSRGDDSAPATGSLAAQRERRSNTPDDAQHVSPVEPTDRLADLTKALRELRDGTPPESLSSPRPPGGAGRVLYNEAMQTLRKADIAAIPVLLEGLDDAATCEPCIQILGDLRAKHAMPKLLEKLTAEDTTRNALIIGALAEISGISDSGFQRFYFLNEVPEDAYQIYKEWYEVNQNSDVPISTRHQARGKYARPRAATKHEEELLRAASSCNERLFVFSIQEYMRLHGSKPAIPFLIDAILQSPDEAFGAEDTLLQIGPSALPCLIDVAQNSDSRDCQRLAQTLRVFDRTVSIPLLVSMLRERKTDDRKPIIWLIRDSELWSTSIVKTLIWILEEDEHASLSLQRAAAGALLEMGPIAVDAVPAIIQFLKDWDLPNRQLPPRRQLRPDNPARPKPPRELTIEQTKGRTVSITDRLKRLDPESEQIQTYVFSIKQRPESPDERPVALPGRYPTAKDDSPFVEKQIFVVPGITNRD